MVTSNGAGRAIRRASVGMSESLRGGEVRRAYRPHRSWSKPLPLEVAAESAGHVDRRAGDVARPVAHQERDESRYLLRLPEPPERNLPFDRAAEELVEIDVGGAALSDPFPLCGLDVPDV